MSKLNMSHEEHERKKTWCKEKVNTLNIELNLSTEAQALIQFALQLAYSEGYWRRDEGK